MVEFDSAQTKSRLRLQAAVSLLHLATVKAYSDMIAPNFILLAIHIQVRGSSIHFNIADWQHAMIGSMLSYSDGICHKTCLFIDSTEAAHDVQRYPLLDVP